MNHRKIPAKQVIETIEQLLKIMKSKHDFYNNNLTKLRADRVMKHNIVEDNLTIAEFIDQLKSDDYDLLNIYFEFCKIAKENEINA
tara:strand:- start:391 stop:648 length:258 start_codon:yes stop_codon:yes gene_type:complete